MANKATTYQLLWRAGYSNGTEADKLTIGGRSLKYKNRSMFYNEAPRKDRLAKARNANETHEVIKQGKETNIPSNADFIQNLLSVGNNTDIALNFNDGLCLAEEYTPQITNKIASYATLAGNSIVAFGGGIRKIGLKITIIKASKFWVPYNAALEAMTTMSGMPSRYLGSLFLHSFDLSDTAAARKYKVVVESLTPVYKSERNTTIDYDMNLLVAYDYSIDKYGKWGKLV